MNGEPDCLCRREHPFVVGEEFDGASLTSKKLEGRQVQGVQSADG
jgi:hypothetical protein